MSDQERLLLRVAGDNSAPIELPRAGVLVIGSSEKKAGLVLSGQGVAEVHCAIGIVKGGGWAVKDMGSEFGTLLNGKKIQQARLSQGDVMLLGSKRLTIVSSKELEQENAPEPAPSASKSAPASTPDKKPELKTGSIEKKPKADNTPKELTETQRAPLLGGYRVEKTLGRGAMGKVFLAVQESLDRRVALKVMAPHLAKDEAFVKQFQDEARSAASLTHPNVVIVHDVGEQRGFHYLSMEYMDRGSLEELLAERGRLAPHEVLDILRDAASGLVYAESRGIVHRDIKPANLMRNHQGATKIADLGLAVSVEAESELEDEGGKKVFGTPHFISPEQLRGETVDARSDLYSLGATTFQLLTGETPFEGETTRDILRGHLKEPARRVTTLVPEIPEGLANLVERLLEKDPEDRYPSAGALLEEVERLRSGTTAAGAGSGGGSGKLVGALVAVALLAGAGAFLFGGKDNEPDPTIAAGNGDSNSASGVGENGAGTNNGEALAGSNTPDSASNVGEGNSSNGSSTDGSTGGSGAGDTEITDDRDLRIFELEAEGAFLRLSQEDLTIETRIARLRAVAENYAGTDAARQALEQALELESASAEEAARLTAVDGQIKNLTASMKGVARLEDAVPKPGEVLKALEDFALPPEFAEHPGLRAERLRLQQAVLQNALDFARTKRTAADAAGQRGERENFVANLAAIVNNLDVPTLADETQLTQLAELRTVRSEAQADMSKADEILDNYAAAQEAADSLRMASGLGGSTGLESELLRLDLAAAKTRLDALVQEVPTASVRTRLTQLRDDMVVAQGALEHLGSTFGDWRRKTIDDPRTGKSATATGSNSNGILISGELVPWAEFGGKSEALSRLFEGRYDGDYAADTRRGILALLTISAALEAVDGASEMFFPSSPAQFTPSEAAELSEGFEFVFEWLEDEPNPEVREHVEREREAARLLARVLRSTDEEQWTIAVAAMERLLNEYGSTLIVLLMSDGTG